MSIQLPRRQFLRQGFAVGSAALGFGALWTPGVLAEELMATPRQTEGPFYPNKLPLDTDNDLLIINDQLTPAVGQITHLSGRVMDIHGQPLRNVVVEIWQVDNQGAYIHTESARGENRDTNFQGFGRFLTNRNGEYYFRTIKPVPYGGRTPHIHYAIDHGDRRLLTTQCYVKGEPQNARDGIFTRLNQPQRDSLLVEFQPIQESNIGELTANFDIVLGTTPES